MELDRLELALVAIAYKAISDEFGELSAAPFARRMLMELHHGEENDAAQEADKQTRERQAGLGRICEALYKRMIEIIEIKK